jgi:purine-binding chemotaxis protein CheW
MATRSTSRATRRPAAPVRNKTAADALVEAQPRSAAPAVPAVVPKRGPSHEPAPVDLAQLLTFFAGGYEYAVSILHVREIAEYRELTPVPGTPDWIRGVMNLRGTVVPAIDLAAKLGMPPTAITRRTCLLIIEVTVGGEETVLAIMVDGVSRVVDLAPADMQEVPSFGPRIDITFLLGMARIDNRLVLLLDIGNVVESADVLSAAALMSLVDSPANESRAEGAVL